MRFRPITARRKQTQQGFILLVIFMMAASIALMLYAQLPRVAFESEREKEQILIDRGEQFIRAIQLYQLDNAGQWPQSLDDLEKHNNKRYLRRRYVDPYTGKDEWRLIHTNGAQLTDSLVTKPPLEGSSSGSNSSASNAQAQDTQVNSAVLARPSDVTLPGAQSFTGSNFVQNTPTPQAPAIVGTPGQQGFGLPGALPTGIQLPGNVQTSGQPQFPGQQFPGQQPPSGTQTQQPGGFQPQFPGQQFPGQLPATGGQTNVPVGFQLGPNGQLVPLQPGIAPAPGSLPGANTPTPGLPGGAGNAGIDVINRLLTTPRTPPTTVLTPQNNALGGGGIAGVASTHTGPSIKTYKERSKYEEWEFVFVPTQGAGGVGGAGGAGGGGGQGGGGGRGQGGGQGGGGLNPGGGGFGGGGGGLNPGGGFGGGSGLGGGGFPGGPGVGGGGGIGAPAGPGAGKGR